MFRDTARTWNKVLGEVETPLERCGPDFEFPEHLVEHVLDSKLVQLEKLRERIGTKSLDSDAIAKDIDRHFLNSETYNCKSVVAMQTPDLSEFGKESLTIGKV